MTSDSRQNWPLDLRLFALGAGCWAAFLATRVLLHDSYAEIVDPLEAVIGGMKFYGPTARVILLAQAGIFWAIAVGMFRRRRWALVLALLYMAEVVMSHFVFILVYFDTPSEWVNVRMAAVVGPWMVLLTLYLWIRGNPLLFDRTPPR
jgi:hypothetical protein